MKDPGVIITINGKSMRLVDAEYEFTENFNIKVIKKGELYAHKIYDSNNSGRRISFTARKDFSHLIKKERNKIMINGIDVFDQSVKFKELISKIELSIDQK